MRVPEAPIIAHCCGNLVGCSVCITQWALGSETCAHCKQPIDGTKNIALKGFDDLLEHIRMWSVEGEAESMFSMFLTLCIVNPLEYNAVPSSTIKTYTRSMLVKNGC